MYFASFRIRYFFCRIYRAEIVSSLNRVKLKSCKLNSYLKCYQAEIDVIKSRLRTNQKLNENQDNISSRGSEK